MIDDSRQQLVTPLVARPGPDNVGLVLADIAAGTKVAVEGCAVPARGDVPAGHKIALRAIPRGALVRKYAETIGYATADIAPGDHVHLHNMGVGQEPAASFTRGTGTARWQPPAAPTREHFLGFRREDGRAATRNYVAVLPATGSSATVARLIAEAAGTAHAGRAGLDGVVALTHDLGRGTPDGGPGQDILRRTLHGYAAHANIAGVLVVRMGGEACPVESMLGATAVEELTIQDLGGTAAALAEGLRRIARLADRSAQQRREPIPVSELVLGLQCGGSDAYSGLTANPTLGVAADLLVVAGGRVVLGETPEIHGAEHLLKGRAAAPELAERIDELLCWWQEYTRRNGAALDDNPSAGNRVGGITTIWEKSLGAVLKAGTSPLNAVVEYAEPVTAPGLTFMDTPGYDPVSATGMVAGGANMLAFTTGRGSLFGSRPVPCVKISTTTRLFRHMTGDVDFDAGAAMSHTEQVRHGTRLFELLVDTASGRSSKSEELGFGAEEIAPWRIGAVL
ncbi:altronate hydrolase [Actinacidiphila yanglinensis]|uniref:Altronate hydrolase n=1 Tax=Actinacidiphila yanglinensis TaxID=310779 RepID=A0A1H6EAY4_9ACTN|nr:altronate dehydratase family protein [Actinacidiphila yanglinensis]SEG94960.1 altronate hydrolase [Actinacidiphila yanglinensis]